jgi:hypothetical protein
MQTKGKTLPASLKDDTARMNDRYKHKVTGQLNRQTANRTANASVFLFFSTAHFLKTILAIRTNGTFTFASNAQADTRGNIKRAKSSSRFIKLFCIITKVKQFRYIS